MSNGKTTIISHRGDQWHVYKLCEMLADTLDQSEVEVSTPEVAQALLEADLISLDELERVEAIWKMRMEKRRS